MTIGERAYKAISGHANQKGVGIVEYAKSIGISQPNLSHWKNAYSEPRAYLLSLMAEAGLDTHWILTGQEDSKVDVVRCKDCQHADCSGCAKGRIYCFAHAFYMDEDGFCSRGESEADMAKKDVRECRDCRHFGLDTDDGGICFSCKKGRYSKIHFFVDACSEFEEEKETDNAAH